jgi:hypothetical protein
MLGVSNARVATIEKDVGRLSTRNLLKLLQLLGARVEVHTSAGVETPIDGETSTPPVKSRLRSPRNPAGEW